MYILCKKGLKPEMYDFEEEEKFGCERKRKDI